jgi:outer membrane protein OmpA-like peptidoglycan-associated protein
LSEIRTLFRQDSKMDCELIEVSEQHRLVGEEMPVWLAVGFTLIGSLLAVAAAWLWMVGLPLMQEWPLQSGPIQDQARVFSAQTDIRHPEKPSPLPAENPAVTAASKEQRDTRAEPQSPLGTPANHSTSPGDLRETTAVEQKVAATSADSSPKREDCPPTITIPFKRGDVQPMIADDIQGHLERLREWLNRHPEEKLAVEGHTDTKGSERYNLLLSYQRAKAVVGFLNKAGVPDRQITILAAGEDNPIEGIPAESEDNRRVILQVNGIKNCQDLPNKSEGL